MHDDAKIMDLWCRIFGHLNLYSLGKVQKMVRGIPQFDMRNIGLCDACDIGNHHRDPLFTNDEKNMKESS